MTDRPIPFSAEMVRAILKGEKTQTRQIATNLPPPPANAIHPNHERLHPAPYLDAYCSEKKTPQNPRGMSAMWCWWTPDNRMGREFRCRYGQPGDTLWVRETWARHASGVDYAADFAVICLPQAGPWRPSIYMPRWASRITLRITDIRVERLQDISEDDAKAEGVSPSWLDEDDNDTVWYRQPPTWRRGFARLWHEINSPGAWEANPWVWVISFERVKP